MSPFRKIELKADLVAALTDHVEPLFVDGMVLTLVARHPTRRECWVVLSDDDPAKVIETIQKAKGRPNDA